MNIPCEPLIKDFLPKIRQQVVLELVLRHKFTQTRAAQALGITQAAVSKYVSQSASKTGSRELNATLSQLGKEYVFKVMQNQPFEFDYYRVCAVCPRQNTGSLICMLNCKNQTV